MSNDSAYTQHGKNSGEKMHLNKIFIFLLDATIVKANANSHNLALRSIVHSEVEKKKLILLQVCLV